MGQEITEGNSELENILPLGRALHKREKSCLKGQGTVSSVAEKYFLKKDMLRKDIK